MSITHSPNSPSAFEKLSGARGLRIAYLVLCTVGLCLSADLARLHLKVHTDPDYHAYCAMSERVNCETVATSEYAVTLGLPTAVWGIFTYLALAALAIWGLRDRLRTASWPFGLLFLVSTAASAYSIALLIISQFVIGSVCLVCVGTYFVNFALVGISFAELKRLDLPFSALIRDELRAAIREPLGIVVLAGLFLAAASVTRVTMPTYWSPVAGFGPGGLAFGTTPEGSPWIGAAKPVLTIYEFSDYQCPHCLRGHEQIRKVVTQNADRVRLVHRHFPLDRHCNPTITKPFHEFACDYSRLAHCAGEQGKFWEANDFLFAAGHRREPVTPDELAEKVALDAAGLRRCVDSADAKTAITRDLAAGRGYSIRGTPTFVIGDQIFPGGIPADVIAGALGSTPRTTALPDCAPGSPNADVEPGACAAPGDDAATLPAYTPEEP